MINYSNNLVTFNLELLKKPTFYFKALNWLSFRYEIRIEKLIIFAWILKGLEKGFPCV
jgi:hypothetical protein